MVFSRAGLNDTISGLVNLYFRDSTGGWGIYKWIDQQDGLGHTTLGLVRWKPNVWDKSGTE
jgi:hypothetical protein